MVVKKVPEKFRSHGVHYLQIERTGDVALFALRYGDASAVIGYDAVKVSRSTLERYNGLFRDTSKQIPGNPDDTVESYPPSSSWGSSAWSFTTLPAAREKYWQLVKQEKLKTLEQVSGAFRDRQPSYKI